MQVKRSNSVTLFKMFFGHVFNVKSQQHTTAATHKIHTQSSAEIFSKRRTNRRIKLERGQIFVMLGLCDV
jgi:hypothetical protein